MNNKKGFTLIELLVVVVIVAILSAVALPQYFDVVEKSRATEALSMVPTIRGALDRYLAKQRGQSDYYTCTTDIDNLDVKLPLILVSAGNYKTKYFLINFNSGCEVTMMRTDNPGESNATIKYQFNFYASGHPSGERTKDSVVTEIDAIYCDNGTETDFCATMGM